jgi:Flp pilus assembly protein TadD
MEMNFSLDSFRRILALVLVLVVTACATKPPVDRVATISRDELLSGAALGVSPDEQGVEVDVLAINDDMRAFLATHVPPDINDKQKAEAILAGLLEEGLNLRYNNFKTYTAQEAFYQREGNCLSFTNLFVALARAAGVDAKFQEVDIPPSWSVDGSTYMNNKHLNIVVKLTGRNQIIDFDMSSFDLEYYHHSISDQAALAQFHNNLGVYWLGEEDLGRSFLHFRKALNLEGQKGYFWTNLGTLYRRAGFPYRAEAAFLYAVDVDDEATAQSNLARLYDELNEPELSAYYVTQVELFRRKNPYYLYDLAQKAYAQRDYEEVKQLMLVATRRRNDEHTFHRLLGLGYVQTGQLRKAKAQFIRAASLATNDTQREHYNHKLELLAAR